MNMFLTSQRFVHILCNFVKRMFLFMLSSILPFDEIALLGNRKPHCIYDPGRVGLVHLDV